MLVGREQELAVLNKHFQQMLEGQGSILFLTGEAGLGKTTLVHAWRDSINAGSTEKPIFCEAACSIPIGNVDVGELEALQPWADIVAQLQHLDEKKDKKLNLKKLIHDSAPSWAWALPLVGDIAHAALETSRLVKEQKEGADKASALYNDSAYNSNAQTQQQVFQQYVNLIAIF